MTRNLHSLRVVEVLIDQVTRSHAMTHLSRKARGLGCGWGIPGPHRTPASWWSLLPGAVLAPRLPVWTIVVGEEVPLTRPGHFLGTNPMAASTLSGLRRAVSPAPEPAPRLLPFRLRLLRDSLHVHYLFRRCHSPVPVGQGTQCGLVYIFCLTSRRGVYTAEDP